MKNKTVQESDFYIKQAVISNNLKLFFGRNQGIRIGESALVSLRLHQPHPRRPGHLQVLIDCDAGQLLLRLSNPNQAVHIDVYHDPALISALPLARKIYSTISSYLEERMHEPFMGKESDRFTQPDEIARRIYLATAEKEGNLVTILRGGYETNSLLEEQLENHVHLLIEVPEEYYGLIYPLIDALEQGIIEQGRSLRKIAGFSNEYSRASLKPQLNALVLPFRPRKGAHDPVYVQNQKQIILSLALCLGGIDAAHDLLKDLDGNILQKMWGRKNSSQNIADQQLLAQLTELGLVQQGLLGKNLSPEGKKLLEYLRQNRQEIEAELRKLLRKTPGRNRRYQRYQGAESPMHSVQRLNRHRVIPRQEARDSSGIAVPETILQAAKRNFLAGRKRVQITAEDVQVYGKRSYLPMDICLLVDCSASMAGEKSQAAWQLAEYLLLSSREKVAVVAFQEMSAQVVVPFTRNHRQLMSKLRTVTPQGLTPLAHGLNKSRELIKNSRVKNPLLVVITDGMPTYPLRSFDSKQDALEEAREIHKNKIRLVCIGVRSNREFLKELAAAGKGTLYIVDNLNRDTLIQVMHEERELAAASGSHTSTTRYSKKVFGA